jgi:glycerol kinase
MLDLHTGAGAAPPASAFPLALAPRGGRLRRAAWFAGAAVDWLVSVGLLASAGALDEAAARLRTRRASSSCPRCWAGTPLLDAGARHCSGLTMRHHARPGHVRRDRRCRAACVDVCEALGVPALPLRVDGGLARSRVLLQRLADAGGRPVLRAAETETTALGAALLAGLATDAFASPAACRALLAPPQRFEPEWSDDRRSAARARWRETVARARA